MVDIRKVIRPINAGSAIPSLLEIYSEEDDRAVAVNTDFPVPVENVNAFLLEVAKGNIPGHKVFAIAGRKDNIDNSVLDDISQVPGTTIVPNPGGIQMEIVSSSPNDTAAGTGAQQVMIHYLDPDGIEQQEIVDTNGVTPVNTIAVDIDRIQWIHVNRLGAGANETAQGNIDLRDTAGVTVFERIAAVGNQSLNAHYHVPANKTGFILGWQVSALSFAVDFRLRATVMRFDRALLAGIFLFQDAIVIDVGASGWIPFEVPLRCPAESEVKISGLSTAAGGDGGAQFSILLIDD